MKILNKLTKFLPVLLVISITFGMTGVASADELRGILPKDESIVNYGIELFELEDTKAFEIYMAMRGITTDSVTKDEEGNELIQIEAEFQERIDLEGTTTDEIKNLNGEKFNSVTKAAQTAIDAFAVDYPEIFWLDYGKASCSAVVISEKLSDGTVKYSIKGVKLNFVKDSIITDDISKAYDEVTDKLYKLVDESKDMSRYDRLKYYHDYLCENIVYDIDRENYSIFTIYGAMSQGRCVCEGYAETFKALCDLSGIPCIIVLGKSVNPSGSTENHMWNYCLMEDDKWYAVDVTMDDLDPTSYEQFLCGSDSVVKLGLMTFEQSHIASGDLSYSGYYSFTIPELSTKSYDDNHKIAFTGILGDVDGSGKVDSSDALQVLRHSAMISVLNDEQKSVADVDADNTVNATDALNILKYVARIIDKFPCEQDIVE